MKSYAVIVFLLVIQALISKFSHAGCQWSAGESEVGTMISLPSSSPSCPAGTDPSEFYTEFLNNEGFSCGGECGQLVKVGGTLMMREGQCVTEFNSDSQEGDSVYCFCRLGKPKPVEWEPGMLDDRRF